MRIIAGEHRGRTLKAPEGLGTRPMLDRVREALFSTIGERVVDAQVLDLFAGSGSLGLEALSRGAARARMIESDPRVVRLLRENVAALGCMERAVVAIGDALARRNWTEEPDTRFDLVFVDSPYPLLDVGKTRHSLLTGINELVREHMADDGLLVFHAPVERVFDSEFGSGVRATLREYGTNAIWYVERAAP